jgi:hypothetical protein
VGQEKEFLAAVNDATKIHNGVLGFRGNAQMMLDNGLFDAMGVKIKGKDYEEKLDNAETFLRQSFGEKILEYGEWVDAKIVDNREVLFGEEIKSK